MSVICQAKEARKIKEFGDEGCEYFYTYLRDGVIESYQNPSSKVVVIVYEGAHRNSYATSTGKLEFRIESPRKGEAEARIRMMRWKMEDAKYPPDLFHFQLGGFRERYSVEIWIVPAGAIPPKPTPTLREMTFRKGRIAAHRCSV